MAETTTVAEVGDGTVAKYKLSAETSGVNLQGAQRWVFSVQGVKGTQEIASSDATNVIDNNDGSYTVFIDTSKTGTGTLKGRVRIEILDTDYTSESSTNIRPEVSLAFDVLKVS